MKKLIQMTPALFIGLLIIVASSSASAAGGGHQKAGIPWGIIFTQAFNLTILLIVLYFALRKKVSKHFVDRASEYNALVNKAEDAKKEAEKSKKEIAQRLAKLKETSEQSLQQVKIEAEQLKTQIIEDARQLANKLEQDAKLAITYEIERAKNELRKELLARAVEDAEKSITADVKDQDLRRMQSEFVQRVQLGGQS